jgi:serine/threonine protein phosphatase PrpC
VTTSYATAQRIGTRTHQCDATATATDGDNRAFVLLDGIGSTDKVRDWTRDKARLLARIAAQTASPSAALAAVRAVVDHQSPEQRHDPDNHQDEPSAVAVVAVRLPGDVLLVGWTGDARAYWDTGTGELQRLTTDHNWAEALRAEGRSGPLWARNLVTSHLGRHPDDHTHGPVGEAAPVTGRGRLLLLSDGVYSPFEDHGWDLTQAVRPGRPREAALRLVKRAVRSPDRRHDNATALVADLG